MFRFSLGHEPSLLDIEDGAPAIIVHIIASVNHFNRCLHSMLFSPSLQLDSGLVAVIFFLLGMGTLLPWNFFITDQAIQEVDEFFFIKEMYHSITCSSVDTFMLLPRTSASGRWHRTS